MTLLGLRLGESWLNYHRVEFVVEPVPPEVGFAPRMRGVGDGGDQARLHHGRAKPEKRRAEQSENSGDGTLDKPIECGQFLIVDDETET